MGVEAIAQNLGLGALLSDLRVNFGGYELLDHWQRGEFHHDLLLRIEPRGRLPGPVLVVATNCNGGVKEVLCLESPPREEALWHYRCPDAPRFQRRDAPDPRPRAHRTLVRSLRASER